MNRCAAGAWAREREVEALIQITSPIPSRAPLAEMTSADALLVMRAANWSEQIPAKLYEYLRARRPILGLADPAGDTAQAMSRAGVEHIAKLEDTASVETSLETFLRELRSGRARLPDAGIVAGASRAARTEQLVRVLDRALA